MRKRAIWWVSIALVILLILVTLTSAALGQLLIPPTEVAGSVLHTLGIDILPAPSDSLAEEALWSVRFPRIVLACLVGMCLAVAGAIMQGIFGNPLAEPGTVGVSSGAAVGAAISIACQWTFLGSWTTPAIAFMSGMLTTAGVYVMARRGGKTEVVTLILTGVAVNAVTGAVISFIVFASGAAARDQIVFWQMGSLAGSRWPQVSIVAPIALVGIVCAFVIARQLDYLALGEGAAAHVGVNVERLRVIGMALVALLVSAAVAFCGIIAFVGLVVPHLLRMIIGPGHRALLPLSALGGAVLLGAADVGARTLIQFADLPIGMLTSLVGGPFFFYLLRRSRARSGGWA